MNLASVSHRAALPLKQEMHSSVEILWEARCI